jgi:phosphoribosylaminoimidazole carboxylase (NCAIR synthetase)
MAEEFPTVGIIGEGPLVQMLAAPALALGVNLVNIEPSVGSDVLAKCAVISVIGDSIQTSQVNTLETAGAMFRPNVSSMTFVKEWNEAHRNQDPVDALFSVMVARSPHGQASAWTPSEIISAPSTTTTITPARKLGHEKLGIAQSLALALIKESNTSGVMEVEIVSIDGELVARHLSLGPSLNGSWTIEGARTSQFEQHLRAILDLPLGDPSLLAHNVVTGSFSGEGNMYRPYLHLMARSPAMKIHQYRSGSSLTKGHVTAMGGDLLDLSECVTHAVEYMSGVINE